MELGSHHMFRSEVAAVNADEKYYDAESGLFRLFDSEPVCYSHGKYYETGKLIGKFGYSVEKRKKAKKRRKA
jgi:flavin reductase (DIM6/NTAB) family NADH-FMN oxidoreductase RutF